MTNYTENSQDTKETLVNNKKRLPMEKTDEENTDANKQQNTKSTSESSDSSSDETLSDSDNGSGSYILNSNSLDTDDACNFGDDKDSGEELPSYVPAPRVDDIIFVRKDKSTSVSDYVTSWLNGASIQCGTFVNEAELKNDEDDWDETY